MDFISFLNKLDCLKLDSSEKIRISMAYDDILSIYSLYKELKSKLEKLDKIDCSNEKDAEELHSLRFDRIKQINILLRSAYIHTDIFINIYLQEITKINKRRFSTQGLITDYVRMLVEKNINYNESVFLSMYCAVIYRNKIIIHHDLFRNHAIVTEELNKDSYMLPFRWTFKQSDIEKRNHAIYELRTKYITLIPEIKELNDIQENIRVLFYNIPLLSDDRKRIDNLIEDGQCPSLTIEGLFEFLNGFIDEVIKVHEIYIHK